MAVAPRPATVDDLRRVEGPAELVSGRIVRSPLNGRTPSVAALAVAASAQTFARARRRPGIVVPGGAAFLVALPLRGSFCPDAAYYEGPNSGMRFFEGAPRFAV